MISESRILSWLLLDFRLVRKTDEEGKKYVISLDQEPGSKRKAKEKKRAPKIYGLLSKLCTERLVCMHDCPSQRLTKHTHNAIHTSDPTPFPT